MDRTYQELLVNTVNSFIYGLLKGPQPGKDPGMTAWAWYGASGGDQPSQVNDWVSPLLVIDMKTVAQPWYTPADQPLTNWALWSSALNTSLSAAPPGSSVRKWLDRLYPITREDPPTVPEDVISWTKDHLPIVVPVVVRRGQGAKSR